MSKTHHTYREWGEYRKQRELTKDFKNWKLEAIKEIEVSDKDSLFSAYIIVNEYEPEDSELTLTEIVGGRWYESESDAWDDLEILATARGYELDHEETAFDVPRSKLIDIARDTYYIEELTK